LDRIAIADQRSAVAPALADAFAANQRLNASTNLAMLPASALSRVLFAALLSLPLGAARYSSAMPRTLFDRPSSTELRGLRDASRALRFEALESRAMLSGGGLLGQYFHNANFTGLAAERIEAVDFSWDSEGPAAGVHPDFFSVRWSGQIEAKYSETYVFRTVSDDGVRLWVDGQLLIDNWTVHTAHVDSSSMALQAGQRYDIRLEYYDNAGASQIRLQWSSPSQALEAIPAAQLYPSPSGLRGEYSDSFGGGAGRIDPGVDFQWGSGRPISGVAVDSFHVRWTGMVRPDFSEEYVFSTLSDEGVRLWIGDELLIDNWTPHGPTTNTGIKTLEAGKWYDIRLEYFDATGNAQISLAWSSDRQTGAGVFETVGAANLRAAKAAPLTYSNPLGPGQDPFVIQWQNSYLHVRSSGSSVWIDRADQLQDIHSSDPASVSVRAWTAPTGTNYSRQIWAPELHQINGKWYIYVAASDGDNATHRMHVLERDNASPMGPFSYKGQISASTDRWAIDGTVLQWQDKLYFIWSGWPGFANGQQNLYIAEMSNPWTISGNRSLLSSPQYSWEMNGMPINEGPQVLIHDGKLHIIYSASGYWTNDYALGRLTYNGVGLITSAGSWTKAPSPVFQRAGEVVGVGHASFTKSPDGTENWIVYHAHHDANNWQEDRDIRIQPFTYFPNGTPNFGTPLPNDARPAAPSGVADADRPLVPGDYDANGAVDATDMAVLTAQFGQVVFPGSAADGNGNRIVDAADFTIWADALAGRTAINTGAPAATAEIDTPPTAASQAATTVAPEASLPRSSAALAPAAGWRTASYQRPTRSDDGDFALAARDWALASWRNESVLSPSPIASAPLLPSGEALARTASRQCGSRDREEVAAQRN
jgi:GH43 family beta-xylosidase